MRNHTIHGHSPQDDLIDFACSDTCRDDYAAQGLTYTADRSKPKAPLRVRDWNDETDALHERNRELELEVRLLKLEKAEVQRPPSNGHSASAQELAEKERIIQSQRRELEALRVATRAAPAQSATPVRVIRKEG